MKKITIITITLMGLFLLTNAQVSDSYVVTPNDLIIQSNGEYDILEIIDHSFTKEIGNPQLPVKIVSYVLPYNSTVIDITVNSISQEKLNGNYYIFPTQPSRQLDWSEPPPFIEPNLDIYNSNIPYPNKTVEIINDGYTHGYHVVTVAIYPIVYYPADREIYLCDISFTINYTTGSSNILSFKKQSLRRAELTKQFVKNMVKNAYDVENCRNANVQIISYSQNRDSINPMRSGSNSAIDVLVPDYIIITNNALKPVFQQLADWKTKKGVPAFIKTVEEIEPEYQTLNL